MTSPRSAPSAPAPTSSKAGANRWWRYGFPASLVALIVAVPVLVFAGSQVVLDSSEGREVKGVTDPDAPGWEASVDPTPLLALAATDAAGDLDHIVLLTLTGEGSGGVVVVPADTLMRVTTTAVTTTGGTTGGTAPASSGSSTTSATTTTTTSETMRKVWADKGPDAVRQGLEGILGAGVPELRGVPASEWATLVGPTAPLTIANVDPVVDSSGTVAFPKGSLSVPADEVASYLTTASGNESELARMTRVAAFWRGWLAAVAADPDGPSTVPGEVESGIGLFVRTLGKGQVEVADLPVRATQGAAGEVYEPDPAEVAELVARFVPFPAGPEGTRARARVLDGTGTLEHGLGAAVLMAANGAQIDKVGNAPQFGVQTTTLTYYDDAARSRVERLREVLGVGEIVRSDELNSAVDVLVVLGDDYASARRDGGLPDVGLTTQSTEATGG